MRNRLYEIQRFIDQHIWLPLGQFAGVVHPVLLLSGLAVFALLAMVGQMHEIYLSYLEPPYGVLRMLHIAVAAAALSLLSAALYHSNYALSNAVIDIVYSEHYDFKRDRRLRSWRNSWGVIIAALPWIGVAWGVSSAASNASERARELAPIAKSVEGAKEIQSVLQASASNWLWALIIVGVIGFASVIFLQSFRRSSRILYMWLALVALLFLAAVFLFPNYMGADTSVRMFRMVGPLAMIVLDALLVFAFVIVLTLLSRKERLPIIVPLIAVALIASAATFEVARMAHLLMAFFVIVAILALLSRRRALCILAAIVVYLLWAPVPSNHHGTTIESVGENKNDDVEQRYREWLDARVDARAAYAMAKPGKSYPVFVIAAEGGGIYAAAAATAFLSRLQEICPSFAQHVFAISGVSGGAVGAAIFQSNVRYLPVRTTGCAVPGEHDAQPKVNADSVIQDDHLSPLLGFIVSDLLGKGPDRAQGLEHSLKYSTKYLLNGGFDKHWEPKRAAPALVLNATWVETGYRVAFAPFRLRGLGWDTLYSFRDFETSDVSLATAAVVSARFPAIVPAFTMSGKDTGSGDETHWNFVDGGYKDSSGASTALDIFNAIERLNDDEGVKPRLILLTSTRPKFKPELVGGARTRDTLAPIITLLSVRDRLADDAITRSIASTDARYAADLRLHDRPQRDLDDWSARLVELDQQKFKLALGWKISKSTHEIVSLLMGNPKLCPTPI